MESKSHIFHKIRGSYPGYIGIELPNDYKVMLMDEENFNAYRKGLNFQAMMEEVKFNYCHFQKPVEGSWHIVIEGDQNYFDPSRINVIYKSVDTKFPANPSNWTMPSTKPSQPAA